MGLFSSKTYYYSGVSSTQLFSEYEGSNLVVNAIIKAVRSGTNITDNLLFAYNNNIGKNLEKYRKYAEDNYIFGLPTAKINPETINQLDNRILTYINYIQSLYPEDTITFEYAQRREPNLTEYLGAHIQTLPGSIGGHKLVIGRYTYNLISTEGKVTQTTNSSVIDAILNKNYITNTIYQVVAKFKDNIGRSHSVRTDPITDGKLYYVAKFTLNGDTEHPYYNVLDVEEHPELDLSPPDVINVTTLNGTFYPVVPIEQNRVYVNSDPASEWYTSTNKLLKKIGLEPDGFVDSLKETPNNTLIQDVYLNNSVNIYTDDPGSLKYLYEFFVNANSIATSETYYTYTQNENGWYVVDTASPIKRILINEQDYTYILSYSSISTVVHNGVIGEIGDVIKGTIDTLGDTHSKYILKRNPYYGQGVMDEYVPEYVQVRRPSIVSTGYSTIVNNGALSIFGQKASYKYIPNDYSISFKKQINETQYVELVVHGVQTNNIMMGSKYAHYNVLILSNHSSDQDSFLIPVHSHYVDNVGFKTISEKEAFYYKSLYLTIYSEQSHKVSGRDRALKFIAGVIAVVAVFYGGAQLYTAITTAATAAAAALAFVSFFVTSIAINYAIKLAVDILGLEGTIIAAIAIAVITRNTQAMVKFLNRSLTEQLIIITSGVTKAVNFDTANKMEEAGNWFREQEALLEPIEEQLEKAESYLDQGSHNKQLFDALYIEKKTYIPYESVTNYYNRTIHTGNIGTKLTFTAVDNYHGIALSLPATSI